jgi:hypothetical protein
MSTTKSESQKNIEAFYAAGGTQDILGKEKYGGKLSSGELQTFLTKYGLTAPAQQAYSADNITAASTAPAPRPDDLMNIRSTIYGELGIPQLQTDYQNLYKQYTDYNTSALQRTNAYDQETDTGQLGIMNQQKTMGVLRGEAAQQSAQRALGQSALAREVQSGSEALKGQLDVLGNKLNMSTTEASERYNIRASEVGDVKNLMLQFPDAGIGFGDSTETMAQKVKKSNENKVVVDLFTQTFGYFPTGLSQESMNKKLAKKYKSTKAYKDVINALALQKLQGTDALTQSENADKARNLAESYVKSVASEVKGGHITREQAKIQIDQKYPGYGDQIYNEVPDNYVIKPSTSINWWEQT